MYLIRMQVVMIGETMAVRPRFGVSLAVEKRCSGETMSTLPARTSTLSLVPVVTGRAVLLSDFYDILFEVRTKILFNAHSASSGQHQRRSSSLVRKSGSVDMVSRVETRTCSSDFRSLVWSVSWSVWQNA